MLQADDEYDEETRSYFGVWFVAGFLSSRALCREKKSKKAFDPFCCLTSMIERDGGSEGDALKRTMVMELRWRW